MSHELRDAQLTIRIPRRLRNAIGAQAEAERRTIADVLNNLLEDRYSAPTPPPKKRADR